jgi:hypothetical protein
MRVSNSSVSSISSNNDHLLPLPTRLPKDLWLHCLGFLVDDKDYLRQNNRGIFQVSQALKASELDYFKLHGEAAVSYVDRAGGSLETIPQNLLPKIHIGLYNLKVLDVRNFVKLSDESICSLLSLCAKVEAVFINSSSLSLEFFEKLKARPHLVSFTSGSNLKALDSHLQSLSTCTHLRKIEVFLSPSVTVKGLTSFSAFAHLKELVLHNVYHIEEWLQGLQPLAKSLEVFEYSAAIFNEAPPIFAPSIGDSGLEVLSNFSKLKRIKLANCAEITDLGMRSLNKLKFLRELVLINCHKVTVSFLAQKKVCDLKTLELVNTAITDETMSMVSRCSDLRRFVLGINIHVTEAGFKQLDSLQKLEELELDGCLMLGILTLQTIAKFANLRALAITRCPHVSVSPTISKNLHDSSLK